MRFNTFSSFQQGKIIISSIKIESFVFDKKTTLLLDLRSPSF